jgi:polysaccharide export outer membrane protein
LDTSTTFNTEVNKTTEIKIQPGDLLRISLSSLIPEFDAAFDEKGPLPDFNKDVINSINNDGFLVNDAGEISIPFLGSINISGLTKEQARLMIQNGMKEYIVDPIVSVRFANFKVTVIGEVNNPSTFYVPTENITIFEAIGLAGDMTVFGLRQNVLLVRESEGIRSVHKINFNEKALLNSPFYYLKQNDVIYIQPDRLKAIKASTNERNLVLAGLAVSILVPMLFNFQNIFVR